MEVVGMLHHLASRQFLILVAVLDLTLILLHLLASTSPLPAFFPSSLSPSSPSADDAAHLRLLEQIAEERVMVGAEMVERVREIRNLTQTLKARKEMLESLGQSLERLERSLAHLQEEKGGAELLPDNGLIDASSEGEGS